MVWLVLLCVELRYSHKLLYGTFGRQLDAAWHFIPYMYMCGVGCSSEHAHVHKHQVGEVSPNRKTSMMCSRFELRKIYSSIQLDRER